MPYQHKKIRQQYHLVRTEKGDCVWDINKLIELVKDMPTMDIPLVEIAELDERHWHEEGGQTKPIARDIALHAKLIYESNLEYPIILRANGRVMDGMHRCCKALILGHETIRAVKFEKDPEPHYVNPNWDDLPYRDNFQETLRRFGLLSKD